MSNSILIVQSGIFLFTLIAVWRQDNLLKKQLVTSDYLRCQIDFTETLRQLFISGKHQYIYDSLADSDAKLSGWKSYSVVQKEMYAYFELMYALVERVFVTKAQGGITEDEWSEWKTWLEGVAGHPLLYDVHRDSRGVFNPEYQACVDEIIRVRRNHPI